MGFEMLQDSNAVQKMHSMITDTNIFLIPKFPQMKANRMLSRSNAMQIDVIQI